MKKFISVLLVLFMLAAPLLTVSETCEDTIPSIVYSFYDGELIYGLTDVPSENCYARLTIYFDKTGYAVYYVKIDSSGEFYLAVHDWCRFITAKIVTADELPDTDVLVQEWPVHGPPSVIKMVGDGA